MIFDNMSELENLFSTIEYPIVENKQEDDTFYFNKVDKYEDPIKDEDLKEEKKENFENDNEKNSISGFTLNFSITIRLFHIIVFFVIVLLYSLLTKKSQLNLVMLNPDNIKQLVK